MSKENLSHLETKTPEESINDQANHKANDKLTSEKKEKNIYFVISYINKKGEKGDKQKNEMQFEESIFSPECILSKELTKDKENQQYVKVCKLKVKSEKKISINLKFTNDKGEYEITFEIRDESFVYDLNLGLKNKKSKFSSKICIPQDEIKYHEKFNYFLEALNKNNEEKYLNLLYKATINLYSRKPNFEFLINLFIKLYENKVFCPLLLDEFKKMNQFIIKKDKSPLPINEKNIDRNKGLEDCKEEFKKIISCSEKLIKENSYEPLNFYGIILCYLNYYDFKTFLELFEKLYLKNKDILFEILIIYKIHFKNPFSKDKDFYIEFIKYSTKKIFLEFYERGLSYLSELITYLEVVDKNKKEILLIEGFKPILIKDFKFNLNKVVDLEQIINFIENILNFSEKNERLLIVFPNIFWETLLNNCKEPNEDNITICFKLREKFENYHKLVNKLYQNKDNKFKKEANDYHERDDYGFLLHKIIIKFIKDNKDIDNDGILNVMKYDIFYSNDKYINKRSIEIFDKINFDKIDKVFIDNFKKHNFEKIFENNINDFLDILCSKINTIYDFEKILELINVKNLSTNIETYIDLLIDKYDSLNINHFLSKLQEQDLEKVISILSDLTNFLYLNQKNLNFLSQKIDNLDKKITTLIYIKLIKFCGDDDHTNMKNHITNIYINNIKFENLDDLMIFIKNLEQNDFKQLMEQLKRSYIIKEIDFYSNQKNINIELLYKLYKNNLFKEENNYYEKSLEALKIIKRKIDENLVLTKQLFNLFKDNEENILEKLNLFLIIRKYMNPNDIYKENKSLKEEIEKQLKDLNYINDALSIYFNEINNREINEIKNTIKIIREGNINDYKNKKRDINKLIKNNKSRADTVNNVKNLIFFKIFYENSKGNDQIERFNKAYEELKNINKYIKVDEEKNNKIDIDNEILEKIREELTTNNNFQVKQEIKKIYGIFNINKEKNENNGNIDEELTIIVNRKIYEKDIKSIFNFFNNFQKDNKEWNKFLLPEYEKEMEIEKLKINLEELKKKNIYNYLIENSSKKSNYIRLFNCLYDKKQAYEFLLKHTTEDIKMLNEKLDPNNSTITFKDIQDTLDCVSFFNELKEKNNFEILEQVKTINDNLIKRFENFAEINESIIELNKNFDSPIYLFKNIKDIFTKASFVFNQDNEVFTILDKEKKKVTIEELKSLKNKIHIKNNDVKKNSNNKENDDNLQQYNDKTNLLICFKSVVNNIEIIYDYMRILRIKGSSLPIFIKINIDYPEVKYYLNNKETNFTEIQKFLFNVKNNIINKLDNIYRDKANLRFLYGKQFDSLLKHLDGNLEIDSIRRYILNNTNNDIIKDGYTTNSRNTEDYVYEYNLYNDNSFDNISNYIKSLFQNNNLSLETHYKNMLIKKKGYKGIYLYESKNESKSMEDDILKIFLDLTGKTPIAQNILISNKETSYEEMQSFFYRAFLCQYNTLFIVEINDSFSDYQQKIMNNFVDKLLNEKNQIHNEKENENIEKTKTEDYLDSCIIFIYKGNESFLDEIKKISPKIFSALEKGESESLSKENIHIITSQVSGLGKTYKIKNMIKIKNKKYIYFPLGGNLTKNIIYNKLNSVLKKIHNKNDYSNTAIHLDLYENNEKSVLNEFLFCFLITKFYSNNENIIYIPKNIEIYIEIPNCFNNYISDYDILNSFDICDIKFEKTPKLNLSKYKVDLFNFMLGLDNNKKIYEFIKKNIGAQKFSYHQINIFINLFISQYSKFNTKLIFKSGGKDVTGDCIKYFAEGTKYFTLGAFSKLLTEQDTKKKLLKNSDYIDLLSEVYTNDLKNEKYQSPLIFIIKEKKIYVDLDISEKGLRGYKCSEDYLNELKKILSLENPVKSEENNTKISLLEIIKRDDYIITNDNFKKMILILYRIIANIPVILMGETGCGKTALIRKLNQLLNDGKENIEIININPGINDKILIDRMNNINEKAKISKELWIFFDELNTCESLALLTEIFINRSYNGTNLEDNIRIIGACNPYRKKRPDKIRCGLSYSNDENELIYLVNCLPQSLMYYVFNFGSIDPEDEQKYILSIISELFEEDENNLKERTKDIISECHNYLRETFDPSIVSLRELSRFKKCCKFLKKYFSYKNEIEKTIENKKLEKIKSIIISVYLCYYIRLVDKNARYNFDTKLKPLMIALANYNSKVDLKELNDDKNKDFLSKIEEPLISDINNSISLKKISKFEQFSQILLMEEDFILGEIELDKGIGINKSLKENIFLLFISLVTKIPLIIIGKPGSGKSLSSQLIYKSMRGKYSKSKFFQKFPSIIQSYFQGSYSTIPEDVENIFEIASRKLNSFKKEGEDLPISMILFDELGLAERSKSNPLKVLHSKLEYDGNQNGVSFVGISNWSLDAAKLNRALSLSVPNLDELLDDLKEASLTIAKSINKTLAEDIIFISILPKVYFQYKKALNDLKLLEVYKQYEFQEFNKMRKNLPEQIFKELFDEKNINEKIKIEEFLKVKKRLNKYLIEKDMEAKWMKKEFSIIQSEKEFKQLYNKDKKVNIDFHGNRDFFYLIKGIANEINIYSDNNYSILIEKYIERNFGGIDIEIDVDLEIEFEEMQKIKKFLEGLRENHKKKKISSVLFFKEIFNLEIENNNYKIKNPNPKYDLNKCINNNINDCKSRYLLLEINPSLAPLIHQNIIKQNEDKIEKKEMKIFFYEGSPFIDDHNIEYQFKMINNIQEHAGKEDLIILQNLNQIYAFLYDLFNMNYIIKDGKKYARICQGNLSDQLTLVNDKFRCIIMVDKKFISNVEAPFLNRFEKMIISFAKLLNNQQKILSEKILKEELNLKEIIPEEKEKIINYKIKDLLIGWKKEDIQGLVYCYSNENKESNKTDLLKDVKDKIFNHIYKLLPQDIIINLPNEHKIKTRKKDNETFHNLKEYIEYINEKKDKQFKISIIYTFSHIRNLIEGIAENASIMISEIKSETQFKNYIDAKINNLAQDQNFIYIHFEQSNSNYMSRIIPFIKNNYSSEDNNYRFIFIVHIKRNFTENEIDNIYSVPGVYNYVNQLFIDNLNGRDISLNSILNKYVKEFLSENIIDLEEEFDKILRKYINTNLNVLLGESNDITKDNYSTKLLKYFETDNSFKEAIIDKAKNEIEEKVDNLIYSIYKDKFINKNSIDIISIIIEYIKDKIFSESLLNIFIVLEDNNILSSLLCQSKKIKLLNNDVIKDIKEKYLKEIKFDKNKVYHPKFNISINIIGFYNFYEKISNFIFLYIKRDYIQNEKKIREFLNGDDKEIISNFHDKEKILLDDISNEVKKDKFIMTFIERIPKELLLNDYITFFLFKYLKNNKFDNRKIKSFKTYNHRLINLLLKIRFNENNKIINQNKNDDKLSFLIKISWIEANMKYIFHIIKLYDVLKELYDNEENLMNLIEETLKTQKITYITNKAKNPLLTKEVNECYYVLLASICLSITSYKIDNKNIYSYFEVLNNALKIIKSLNDELLIFLNEMYIIDEIICIYEVLKINDKININNISEINKNLRKNSQIIQKNEINKIDQLVETMKELDDLIKKSLNPEDKEFYNLLNDIYTKEIKKINDINYRESIFEYILSESEIIRKSNEVLQLLLKTLIIPIKGQFINTIKRILNEKNEIINLIEILINDINDNNSFVLSETLLYYFEKNSHIYLYIILNNEKKEIKEYLEDEPLDVFRECVKFLDNYNNNSTNIKDKKKNICKLFSIAYIKSYLYSFISSTNDINPKFRDYIKIINEINKSNSLTNILHLYIYKIIYNLNNRKIEIFMHPDIISKYKLREYNDFNKFKNFPEYIPFNYIYNNPRNKHSSYYDNFYDILYKSKLDDFNNFDIKKFNLEKYGIDIFYFATNNLILSNLKLKDFTKSSLYKNFYNNVCVPLFFKNKTILTAISFLYSSEKFEKIKKEFIINDENLDILLFSYRYCINILYNLRDSIYNLFYTKNNNKLFEKINNYYYPGNDIKNLPRYQLYSKIYNHFENNKSNVGCYICLCQEGYYFSMLDKYNDPKYIDTICPKCKKPIGLKKKMFGYNYIKRENYFRIFKNENELKKFEDDIETERITLEKFKENYIEKYFIKEKGITIVNEDYFKKDNKIIRNLSQISYRLLNFILYSNLFFARLYTENKKFDNYIPKNMTWMGVISESWELLNIELKKKKINDIDLFMNYIFYDVYTLLSHNNIEDYNNLIFIEDKIEQLISKKINEFKKERKSFEKLYVPEKNNKNFNILLVNENYENFDLNEYPFYKNFYFTKYINEDYLYEQLKHKENNKYPVLLKYLEYYNSPKDNNPYSLAKLKLFNDILNLYNEKYSHYITREESEQIILEQEDLYKNQSKITLEEELYKNTNKNNLKPIDDFIKFYNELNLVDENKNKLVLKKNSKLSNLFIDDNNNIGKSYKEIYKKFIKKQNNEIKELIKMKINEGIFDSSALVKVNIQNITKDEIFLLDLPKNYYFIDIVFNCSYRDIEDKNDYKNYNQFKIDFDLIEEKLTDILIKNKKLFNENISNFVYKNEEFNFENIDIITKFQDECLKEEITIDDKIILYQYYQQNNENTILLLKILNDFIKLIININNNKDLINNINEKKYLYIYELFKISCSQISEDFQGIFNEKNNFTILKLSNIFEYFQKLIFENICKDLEEYQNGIKEDKKQKILEYFESEHKINKDNFSTAIRTFITLFLSFEKNKKYKIKSNCNNIINYLNIPDIWSKKIYNMKEYNDELNELKKLNIQMNEILPLYRLIGEKIDFNDVILEIQKNDENERKRKEDEEMANQRGNIDDKYEEKEENEDKKSGEKVEDNDDDDYYNNDEDDNVAEFFGRD